MMGKIWLKSGSLMRNWEAKAATEVARQAKSRPRTAVRGMM